jgi:hypothetical protein
MADVKISALPASTVPLAGTEVLPVVQGGATKQVSVANLTAGRSVSATSFVPTSATVPVNGMFLGAANSVSIATNTTEHWMVNASGNLNPVGSKGIGTSLAPVAGAVSDSYQLSSNGIITEATTARTLSATDNGKVIYCTSASATTITCAASLGAGFSVTIIQGGAGKVTVAAGAATLVSYSSLFSTMGQYACISLISPVANTFVAAGNLGV